MTPRREIGCVDGAFLAGLPALYALLVLMLSRWLAQVLGVALPVVALPLAVVPVVAAFGRHWRNAWIVLVPVLLGVLLARPFADASDWRRAGGAALGGAMLWIPAMFLIGAVLRRVGPKE